jgi:hypothetical protein
MGMSRDPSRITCRLALALCAMSAVSCALAPRSAPARTPSALGERGFAIQGYQVEIVEPGKPGENVWSFEILRDASRDGDAYRLRDLGNRGSFMSPGALARMEGETLDAMVDPARDGFFTQTEADELKRLALERDPELVTWLRIFSYAPPARQVSWNPVTEKITIADIPGREKFKDLTDLSATYLKIVRGQKRAPPGSPEPLIYTDLPWVSETAKYAPEFVARHRPDPARERFVYEIGRAENVAESAGMRLIFALGAMQIAQDVLRQGGKLSEAFVYGHTKHRARGRLFGSRFPLDPLGEAQELGEHEKLFRSSLARILNDRTLRAWESFPQARRLVELFEGKLEPAQAIELGHRLRGLEHQDYQDFDSSSWIRVRDRSALREAKFQRLLDEYGVSREQAERALEISDTGERLPRHLRPDLEIPLGARGRAVQISGDYHWHLDGVLTDYYSRLRTQFGNREARRLFRGTSFYVDQAEYRDPRANAGLVAMMKGLLRKLGFRSQGAAYVVQGSKVERRIKGLIRTRPAILPDRPAQFRRPTLLP